MDTVVKFSQAKLSILLPYTARMQILNTGADFIACDRGQSSREESGESCVAGARERHEGCIFAMLLPREAPSRTLSATARFRYVL